jgi:4-amino-4-deoxy-L-arabinose transferase-like glycosyltransferase
MSSARAVKIVWLCFLLRVWFYAAMLPVWEGYDEWSHFGVIRLVALRGQLLPPRDSRLPRDVDVSLTLAPLPWSWRQSESPRVPQDEFWHLPQSARADREAAFRRLPRDWQVQDGDSFFRAHEAYQPPLYYWTMALLMRLLRASGIAAQLLAVRWFGALLGSFAIPLTFLVARELLGSPRMAVACAAVVAVMPGFALVVGHAGNDCLAIGLFSLLIWCGVRVASGKCGLSDQLALGIALGLGLLTKAYFLTAIPAVSALAIWKLKRRAAIPLACALLLAGWWYLRAWLQTGTLTGLTDFVMAQNASSGGVLHQISTVPWGRAIDSILFSHLYAGGWSFLQVRSWIYHLFYLLAFLSLIGLAAVRRTATMLFLAAVYACFWIGELYHVVILWMARGVPTSMGYYLYGVVAAQASLCTAGLARFLPQRKAAWAPAAGVALFAALDLYAMHAIAIPYYTGIIRHKPNGALAALHADALSGFSPGEILVRLTAFKSPPLSVPAMFLLWTAYLLSTLGLLAIVFSMARSDAKRNSTSAEGFATY